MKKDKWVDLRHNGSLRWRGNSKKKLSGITRSERIFYNNNSKTKNIGMSELTCCDTGFCSVCLYSPVESKEYKGERMEKGERNKERNRKRGVWEWEGRFHHFTNLKQSHRFMNQPLSQCTKWCYYPTMQPFSWEFLVNEVIGRSYGIGSEWQRCFL